MASRVTESSHEIAPIISTQCHVEKAKLLAQKNSAKEVTV